MIVEEFWSVDVCTLHRHYIHISADLFCNISIAGNVMETNEDGESSSSSTPRYRPDGIEALCAATGTYCTYALYHHIIINILWLLASTCC